MIFSIAETDYCSQLPINARMRYRSGVCGPSGQAPKARVTAGGTPVISSDSPAADHDRTQEGDAHPGTADSDSAVGRADDPPGADERLDGFISYTRRSPDKEFVDWLSRELANRDKRIWLDRASIEPAADWRARITRGIELANAFIFVISPASATSAECMAELAAAVANHKRIIPVVLSHVPPQDLPASLSAPNWIDFQSPENRAAQVDRVVEALEADLEWRDASTRLATRARDWEASGRDRSFLLRGADLKTAEAWSESKGSRQEQPTNQQHAYLAASRRGTSHRLRLGLTAALCALAVAVTLSIVAVVQRNSAVTQSHISQSEQLAAEATGFSATNAPRAMLLSVAAYQRASTAEARTALIQAAKQPLDLYLTAGTSAVTAIAYSADGKELAVGDADGHITMWDTATWRHNGLRLSSGSSEITALAFSSPDQHYFVAADSAGRSGVWDTQTGKAQISGRTSRNPITCLAFSANGKFFAAGFSGGTVLLSNLATGHSVTLSEGYPLAQSIGGIAFSPDGQTLAVGNTGGGVQLWDTTTGRRSENLLREDQTTAVSSLAFSPDGKTVAVAGYSDLIRLWSVPAASETASLPEDSAVDSITYSPDGNTIAAGTVDGTVGLWNVSSRTQTATFGEGSSVEAVAYSPDGNTLAVADASGHVGLWSTTQRNSTASTFSDGDGSPVTNVTFTPDGKTLATGDLAGNVELWGTSNRRRIVDLSEVLETYSTAFSPSGRILAVGYLFGVDLWNVADQQHPVREPGGPGTLAEGGDGSDSVAFNPDGTILAVGDYDGGVGLWDVASRHRLATMKEGASVNSVAFSPDGKILAVGDADGNITLWSVASHDHIATLAEGSPVNSVAFSPGGRTIAAGDRGGNISLWQVTSHQRTVTLPDGSAVDAVAFSPDGQTLASGDAQGDVDTWNLATDQLLATIAETGTSITSLAFSRDGRQIAAGGYNGMVTLLTQRTLNSNQDALTRLICSEVKENITPSQWADDAPGVPYQKACPAYP
jgi:WD40 repeat protein